MPDIRREVKEEIDRMSDAEVSGLQKFLQTYPDPVMALARNAPWDDEPVTEEMLRSLDEDREWLEERGGRGYPHDEVMRRLGLD